MGSLFRRSVHKSGNFRTTKTTNMRTGKTSSSTIRTKPKTTSTKRKSK